MKDTSNSLMKASRKPGGSGNAMSRRRALAAISGGVAGVALAFPQPLRAAAREKKMGVSIASYGIRTRAPEEETGLPGFRNAVNVLNYCHELGAGGVQVGVRGWEQAFARKVRDRREALGMFLEGQIRLPKDEGDVDRFAADARNAREAGAEILRTVMLSGRRYENFDSALEWREFRKRSWHSLTLAEPIIRKLRLRLAIENHKDWRVPELLDILTRIGSGHVGVNIDFGNSISLLEDPLEVVRAYAPHAFTTHFKDMGVQEYDDGFLLSEVPLGDGFFDLKAMIELCEKHNPKVQFNLEMITRDPLKVPCLSEHFWATFGTLPGVHLARSLSMVRKHASSKPLPRVSGKSLKEKVAFEDRNVRRSFDFARKELGWA